MKMGIGMCALALLAVAWPARADTVRWESPWTPGIELVYETVQDEDTLVAGEPHETTHWTDVETVRITEALPGGGYVQEWSWEGAKGTLIVGDAEEFAFTQRLYEALSGLPLVVELDADAHVAGLRNLDAMQDLFEEKVKPLFAGMIAREFSGDIPEGLDPAMQARLQQALDEQVAQISGQVFADMFSRERLERMSLYEATLYNGLAGTALEPGMRETRDAGLLHPVGGESIPARLELLLSRHEGIPDAWRIDWTRTPDMSRADRAVRKALEEMHVSDLPEGVVVGPDGPLKLVASGFHVFRGTDGVVLLSESRLETAFGPVTGMQRRRMRLVGGGADWPDGGR